MITRLVVFALFAGCLNDKDALASSSADFTELPLIFDHVPENPFKTRVYLNPAVPISIIKEISRRDVIFVKNNESLGIEERLGPWVTLVSNDAAPSIRYSQLKASLCEQKDYRISWIDRLGKEHDSVVQRLPATPQAWAPPSAHIQVTGLSYEEPVVAMTIDWSLSSSSSDEDGSDSTISIDQRSSAEPVVELLGCETLFEEPAPPPVVVAPRKTVYFHRRYVDHSCAFAVRLRATAYDAKRQCLAVVQTADEKSLNVTLRCDKIVNYKCGTDGGGGVGADYVQGCRAVCDVALRSRAERRSAAKSVVKLSWTPLNAPRRVKPAETLLRLAAMDALLNNFALSQSKQTVLVLNATTKSYDLTPFDALSLDSFVAVQVCVFYELCDKDPRWDQVPAHAIYATRMIDQLTPVNKSRNKNAQTSTKMSAINRSTTTTTTPEPASTTEVDIIADVSSTTEDSV